MKGKGHVSLTLDSQILSDTTDVLMRNQPSRLISDSLKHRTVSTQNDLQTFYL